MARRKGKRLEEAAQAGTKPTGRTRLLGGLAGGAVVLVFGAEVARVWRLGMLPVSREEAASDEQRGPVRRAVKVLREGYAVSRTRENTLFNMLASFATTFGITRGITVYIREHGGLGPIQNVVVGSRHIHHFIPGGLIALGAGGVAIGMKGDRSTSTSPSRSGSASRSCSTSRRCCSSSRTSTGPRRASSACRSSSRPWPRSPRSPT